IDFKYGARHLKRAIERYIVFPLSNLVATEQIDMGDLVIIEFDSEGSKLLFSKETGGALIHAAGGEYAEHFGLGSASDASTALAARPKAASAASKSGEPEA